MKKNRKAERIMLAIKNRSVNLEAKKAVAHIVVKDDRALYYEQQHLVYETLRKRYANVIQDFHTSNRSSILESNQVWIFWEQGYNNAPPLIKACINSVMKNLSSKKVTVLSGANLKDYIKLPDYIEQKYAAGKIKPAHYSDLVRLELLCQYGGLWLDSTVLCTSKNIPGFFFSGSLFVFKEACLNRQTFQCVRASNWLIFGQPYSNILRLTRELLFAYWKDFDYAVDYLIFHLFFSMASRHFPEEWDVIPAFNNHTPHAMMFELAEPFSKTRWNQLTESSPFHKLERHTDYSHTTNSLYKHIINQYRGE